MVSAEQQVFILSNDIVPGLGMPVAAPGLRAFGLAEGLRANGLKVKTIITRGFVDRQWFRFGSPVPHPTAPDTEVVGANKLSRYLKSNAPATVVMINSNQVDHLKPIEGIRYVLDFFAPKMLETLYQRGEEYPGEELARLRRRKIRAIELADAFVVNGEKKLPYFLAWILQADRDIRQMPFEVVNMCVPLSVPKKDRDPEGPVKFAVAGYLQSWSTLGDWVKVIERQLGRPEMSLDLLVPWHWGGGNERSHESKNDLDRLTEHASVTAHSTMNYAEFQKFLSTVDVTIDLFQHNLEREYAMVTRSVISLACGVPVIHSPFTEVSPWISLLRRRVARRAARPGFAGEGHREHPGKPRDCAAKAAERPGGSPPSCWTRQWRSSPSCAFWHPGRTVADRKRMYFMTPTFRPVWRGRQDLRLRQPRPLSGLRAGDRLPRAAQAHVAAVRDPALLGHFAGTRHPVHQPGRRLRGAARPGFSHLAHPLPGTGAAPQPGGRGTSRVIFIVQNVRWANPDWINGYSVRLLSRPMARIMTNDTVLEAVEPYLNETSLTEVIRIGHDSNFFARRRTGPLGSPLKVGYTTWKSDVGDRVAGALAKEAGFEFRAIREPVGWGRATEPLSLGRCVSGYSLERGRVLSAGAGGHGGRYDSARLPTPGGWGLFTGSVRTACTRSSKTPRPTSTHCGS